MRNLLNMNKIKKNKMSARNNHSYISSYFPVGFVSPKEILHRNVL